MTGQTFDSVVARSFEKRIQLIVAELGLKLIEGSSMDVDPMKLAMKYNQEIAYVRGLQDSLVFLREVEDDLQGRRPTQSGVPLSDRE